MNEEIQTKIEELMTAVKKHSPDSVVAFRLFFNSAQVEIEFEQFRKMSWDDGTMRNLRGEWVCEDSQK